jgi:hypothetical protein
MSDSEPSEKPPQIIVDEDWKAQVEKEKEAFRDEAPGDQKGKSSHPNHDSSPPLPPAALEGLVSMLASQAMASLGLLPHPETGAVDANRPLAKFLIDTLAVLEEKTKGNRTEDETAQLRDALHHLRMIYVASIGDMDAPAPTKSARSPIIELP